MYKVLGTDGKEYGPISLEQLGRWVAEGRVVAQTRVQGPDTQEWKAAGDLPEIKALFGPGLPGVAALPSAPVLSAGLTEEPRQGLAITSLVLGLFGLVCMALAGIPAIVCGHVAHLRARRNPAQYGGGGMAIAGFVLGYISLCLTVFVTVRVVQGFKQGFTSAMNLAKGRAQEMNCINNLNQIGVAFHTWALDNTNQFPFNVSTNNGGTLELCARGADGFDRNAYLHFMAISNELSIPYILVCPGDTKQAAFSFAALQATNCTYTLRTGTNINNNDPRTVLAVCPIHGTTLRVDGSVHSQRTNSTVRRKNLNKTTP
jgi:hypothetical protein